MVCGEGAIPFSNAIHCNPKRSLFSIKGFYFVYLFFCIKYLFKRKVKCELIKMVDKAASQRLSNVCLTS